MERRQFVRLVGGGVVMAAAAPLAGCAGGLPAEATAAWEAPAHETDPRRWVVAHAILAPHSHNLQSWLVDLRVPGDITLRCDPARLLPATDPFSRQIMMSHGTFLELLDIAARERGLRAETALFPEGAFDAGRIDGRPVARIRLREDAAVAKDPLFAQILRRRTNRSAYDVSRAVPPAAWDAMRTAAAAPGLRFGFAGPQDAALIARHRAIASEAWRIEILTPAAMMESMKVLRIGSSEIARHRDGIAITSPLLVTIDRLGLFDRSRPPAPDSRAARGQIDDFDAKIATTSSFLWITSDGNDRATQVAAGRAYARVQLAATAHGVAMQPLQQALQEYPEQAGPYAAIHALLGAARPAQTVQMWARVGFAPAVPPAPRRGLDAQLVKA